MSLFSMGLPGRRFTHLVWSTSGALPSARDCGHLDGVLPVCISYKRGGSCRAKSGCVVRVRGNGCWAGVVQFSSVQSLSHVRLFVTLGTAARQASLSITNPRSPPKPMSIESVMPSNHLILCPPLLLLPPIPPSIRVFSNESTLRMRWLNYWSFSFNSVLPMNTQD